MADFEQVVPRPSQSRDSALPWVRIVAAGGNRLMQ